MPYFQDPSVDHCVDDHEGYVAGRDRAGIMSGSWTDVRRHPPGTHVAHLARCVCGWTGPEFPADGEEGYRQAQRSWRDVHLAAVLLDRPPPVPAPEVFITGGYVPEKGPAGATGPAALALAPVPGYVPSEDVSDDRAGAT